MTPGLRFLISCCKTSATASEVELIGTQLKEPGSQPLSGIVSLAQSHGVLPLVYQTVQTHVADFMPEESLAELRQLNTHIVMQNMYMSAELVRILALLNKNGIQALAFKGPALSQLAYGDIALRQYVDLDILIRKQDIAKSIALLVQDGYQAVFSPA
jgi:hypothetical protein